MQDMYLRFHYDDFAGAVRQQAELWEPYQTLPYDSAEDKIIYGEIPSEAMEWGPTYQRKETTRLESSIGSNRYLDCWADEATSHAWGPREHCLVKVLYLQSCKH